jgi:hypothetical protein
MKQTNRQIVLAARPDGLPKESDLRLVEGPVPEISEGQLLVRAHYLSADPFQRLRMNDSARYGQPLALDEVFRGRMVGEVVRSNHAGFTPGEFVEGMLGWQEYAVSDGSYSRAEYAPGVTKVDPDLAPISTSLGILGFPGVTSYFALLELCEPKPGETVVITSAAGAVGSLAGQIAKIKGCRVVGLTSTDEKVAYIVDELGFDAGINYRTEANLSDALQRTCPDRIDVHFDNVGGEIADTILRHLNTHARIALVGGISHINDAQPRLAPDLSGLLTAARARLQGFIVYDYEDRADEARHAIASWLKDGRIKYRETVMEGIENAPRALISVLQGGNIGKQLIKVI